MSYYITTSQLPLEDVEFRRKCCQGYLHIKETQIVGQTCTQSEM